MQQFRIMWLLQYFPCHDHRIPPEGGPHTEADYWFAGNNFSTMNGEINRR